MNRPSFEFNPLEYLIDQNTSILTLEEEGAQWRAICKAASKRDFAFLRKFPFIGKTVAGVKCRPGIPGAIKREVLSVGKCAHCSSTQNLEIDHIYPYSKGGTHDRENLQCLCRKCNSKKRDQTP